MGFTVTGAVQKMRGSTKVKGLKIATPLVDEGPVYHVGLDVHAADFVAAIADPGRDGEVRELGAFTEQA